MHHAFFLYISSSSLPDYNLKIANVTFLNFDVLPKNSTPGQVAALDQLSQLK